MAVVRTPEEIARQNQLNPPRDLSKPYGSPPVPVYGSAPPTPISAALPQIGEPATVENPAAPLPPKYADPFAALSDKYNAQYQATDMTLQGLYDALAQQLEAGKQEFNTRSGVLSGQIGSAYDAAANDIAAVSNPSSAALAKFAASIGGSQALAGQASQNLTQNLSRIAALNATNKAASQSNFDLRRGNLADLLIKGQQAGAQQGAAARSNLAMQATNRFGATDPALLYQQYLQSMGQQDIADLQLQLQQQQLLAGQSSGGGGGGGGGGRRSSGGGSSTATAGPGSWPPTYEEALAAAGGDTNAADTIIRLATPNEGLQQRLDTYKPSPTVVPGKVEPAYKGKPTGGSKAV